MIESFNANFVRARAPEGEEYTPFFNSMIEQGIYLPNFYGNSVQTDKGQLAVFCSLFPLTSGKVFTDYPDIHLQSLPEILGHNGYETIYFQSFSNLSADNTGYFMRRHGFHHVYAMDRGFTTRGERRKYFWGWGIQDDILYQKVFLLLDNMHERDRNNKNPPYFVTLSTISSHTAFNRVPPSQRYIYHDPKNQKECYANAIRVADEYLKTFFRELRKRDYLNNSVVLITGDHSFPVGEHGIFYNEIGFFEENFKTPLLILGKGISRSVIERPHSQLDIAPTVLELSGVSAVTHFSGSSIFQQGPVAIPLIQPYAGKYFAIIRYPYKYVFSKKFDKEYLFNIDKDPREEMNLFPLWKGKPLIHDFHSDVQWILLNDFRIRHDQIWKESNAH
jgi:phosphoglycerol transferase MdoB-like AlkP superfamily enzyme